MRGGGCRHGSGVLWVRGSDCWAAAGSGGHSGGATRGGRHRRRCRPAAGEAVTGPPDPRDPAISNLEDDSFAWHFHWVLLGLGLFVMAIPAIPVVAGVFADGPRGRLARARRARRGLTGDHAHPETPLDEKVSDATLVEWAAWAASTTFSSTGLRFGYDMREVDAFRSAVRDTFLGGKPTPAKSR